MINSQVCVDNCDYLALDILNLYLPHSDIFYKKPQNKKIKYKEKIVNFKIEYI